MSKSPNNNYIDLYEQIIDEDPEDRSFEMAEDNHPSLFDEYDQMEEKAYEDLAEQTKKSKMIQTGGNLRTQEKRPISRKLAQSF